jgi:glycosyltransferase involved in cell wall biosynthesis
MKIAIIAPPWIPIPPPKYGGIEIVVYNLIEGLRKLGHKVILFGHRDSNSQCEFFPYTKSQLDFGLNSSPEEKSLISELALKYAFSQAAYEKVDIIHSHVLYKSTVDIPTVYTVYSAATEGSIFECGNISQDKKNFLVAVSNRQRDNFSLLDSSINFINVVNHAIDVESIEWTSEKEDNFLFVGEASWQRGPDSIIRVAAKAEIGLRMVIKLINEQEKEFYHKEVKPLIANHPKDLFLQIHKEISRNTLLGLFNQSKCTLVSSKWEQPFALCMIESMACGTPVIAFRRGGASDIIVDGKTGFVVDTEDEMIKAIKKVDKIKAEDCRRHAENNFSQEIMAKNYLKVYEEILNSA